MSNQELTQHDDFTSVAVVKARENVYDEQLHPLVNQIYEICKANNIGYIAAFQFGDCPDPDQADMASTFTLPPTVAAYEALTIVRALRNMLKHCANV